MLPSHIGDVNDGGSVFIRERSTRLELELRVVLVSLERIGAVLDERFYGKDRGLVKDCFSLFAIR